jgi:hypothetical protein
MKTQDKKKAGAQADEAVQFCTNCDDMENIALDDPSAIAEAARKRFDNCRKTGKFQGDICSRLFVIDDATDDGSLFDDATER